ncbi:hypothetical protein CH289_03530, partial [Rhodococcus sp. RS1C4]
SGGAGGPAGGVGAHSPDGAAGGAGGGGSSPPSGGVGDTGGTGGTPSAGTAGGVGGVAQSSGGDSGGCGGTGRDESSACDLSVVTGGGAEGGPSAAAIPAPEIVASARIPAPRVTRRASKCLIFIVVLSRSVIRSKRQPRRRN